MGICIRSIGYPSRTLREPPGTGSPLGDIAGNTSYPCCRPPVAAVPPVALVHSIDGETAVDLDDLDLVAIHPLPSYVCIGHGRLHRTSQRRPGGTPAHPRDQRPQ